MDTGVFPRGESAWIREPFHGESQCGPWSRSTGRVSVDTGALPWGESVWTQEPFRRESQCGPGSPSTGRVSVDMGALPRGESAWTREPFHGENQRGHGSPSTGRVSVDTRRNLGLRWPASRAGPVPLWASVSSLYIQSTDVKNQQKQKENKTKRCTSRRKRPPGDPAPDREHAPLPSTESSQDSPRQLVLGTHGDVSSSSVTGCATLGK